MLHPYQRPPPPRPPSRLDAWLGRGFRLLERHELDVDAPPAAALSALAALRIAELPAVRALFSLRRLPHAPDQTLRAFFSTAPFVALEEDPGAELVAGVLLPARGETGRAVPATPQAFREALARAPLAVVANFRAEPRGGGARLWTETWVRARGRLPGAAFGLYWLLIGPWSAWIRRLFLRAARARAEAARGAPHEARPRVRG